MRPADQTAYIVACIRESGSMYSAGAEAFLDEHDAHRRAEVLTEVDARFAAMTMPEDLQHTLNAATYRHAWLNCRAIVRDMAGKDTRGAVQASVGESTQLGPNGCPFCASSTNPDLRDHVRNVHHDQFLSWAGVRSPGLLAVRWDREVIHPKADPTEPTIVCCIAAETGQPVALFLDDEHREALGLMLVDPDPDDQPTPDFFQPDHSYQRGRWTFTCLAIAPRPWDGETRAVGYLSRNDGTGTETALGQRDWTDAGWTEVAEGGEPRG